VTNPASNEKLLEALAEDFQRNGYSVKHTERLILNSRIYQLSSVPNDTNRHDTINHSRYYLKRMMAEQLMDAVVQVTGVEERLAGWPPGTRAMTIPHGSPSYLLTVFGRVGDREFIRERDNDPNITQTLHLINGETLHQKITSPEGNLPKWLAKSDERVLEYVFLATVSRRPRTKERDAVVARLRELGTAARTAVFQDVLWALMNSKEFLYVH